MKSVWYDLPQKRRLILEAAGRDDIGIEVKNAKRNKCSEILMIHYLSLENTPLSYNRENREKEDGKYTTRVIRTSS